MSFLWNTADERTYKSLCRMADHEEKTKAWDEIDPTFAEARNLIERLHSTLCQVTSERDALLVAPSTPKDAHGR